MSEPLTWRDLREGDQVRATFLLTYDEVWLRMVDGRGAIGPQQSFLAAESWEVIRPEPTYPPGTLVRDGRDRLYWRREPTSTVSDGFWVDTRGWVSDDLAHPLTVLWSPEAGK